MNRSESVTSRGPVVIEVSFQAAGKLMPYLCEGPGPEPGSQVVVESERGTSLASVALTPRAPRGDEPSTLPHILRIAGHEDLLQEERNREREAYAFKLCLRLLREHALEMKLIRVHYLVGATKAVFYFTADGRVDFRALVRDLAADLRLRIEMRQIGVRDETKMLGGVGHCGRELCCATWLRSFVPVSIRMAKDQNLALNPQKVSGACGRLMCCLAYEHEGYVEMKRNLPKIGRKVNSTRGIGRVVSLEILTQRVAIELEEGGRVVVSPDELLALPDGQSKAEDATESTPDEGFEI